MPTRRTFLASLTALFLPVAIWKRSEAGAAPSASPSPAPPPPPGRSPDVDFRRYLRQAARAQAGSASTTPNPA